MYGEVNAFIAIVHCFYQNGLVVLHLLDKGHSCGNLSVYDTTDGELVD